MDFYLKILSKFFLAFIILTSPFLSFAVQTIQINKCKAIFDEVHNLKVLLDPKIQNQVKQRIKNDDNLEESRIRYFNHLVKEVFSKENTDFFRKAVFSDSSVLKFQFGNTKKNLLP